MLPCGCARRSPRASTTATWQMARARAPPEGWAANSSATAQPPALWPAAPRAAQPGASGRTCSVPNTRHRPSQPPTPNEGGGHHQAQLLARARLLRRHRPTQAAAAARPDRQRAGGAEHQRVAVAVRLRRDRGADRAAGAGTVVDQARRAEILAELLTHHARPPAGRTARRGREGQPDWPVAVPRSGARYLVPRSEDPRRYAWGQVSPLTNP